MKVTKVDTIILNVGLTREEAEMIRVILNSLAPIVLIRWSNNLGYGDFQSFRDTLNSQLHEELK